MLDSITMRRILHVRDVYSRLDLEELSWKVGLQRPAGLKQTEEVLRDMVSRTTILRSRLMSDRDRRCSSDNHSWLGSEKHCRRLRRARRACQLFGCLCSISGVQHFDNLAASGAGSFGGTLWYFGAIPQEGAHKAFCI